MWSDSEGDDGAPIPAGWLRLHLPTYGTGCGYGHYKWPPSACKSERREEAKGGTQGRMAMAFRRVHSERSLLCSVWTVVWAVRANITLRLDNLQVVNAFNDGAWRFTRNWLRRNDRNLATLAWKLDEERAANDFGKLTAVHQLGHAEKRKKRSDFDTHEKYNDKVDGLTHAITGDMPDYASFARDYTGRTTLWHEPSEQENVGCGALHKVTCDVYKHITRSYQRRLSLSRLATRDGALLASHSRGAVGRAKSERASPLIAKIMHEHLPTDARHEL